MGFEGTSAVDVRGQSSGPHRAPQPPGLQRAQPVGTSRDSFTNRGQWGGSAEYQRLVTGPMKVLGLTEDVMPSLVRYVECKCLVSGVTTSQGIELFSNAGARRY